MGCDMQWFDWVRVGAAVAAFAAAAWFGWHYGNLKWEKTSHGRNVMYVTIGVGLVAASAAIYIAWGTLIAGIVEVAAWLFLAGAFIRRRQLMLEPEDQDPTTTKPEEKT